MRINLNNEIADKLAMISEITGMSCTQALYAIINLNYGAMIDADGEKNEEDNTKH